ncbi:hypothetical protein BH10PLA2_BH10PLA2_11770 [soil metagenome]
MTARTLPSEPNRYEVNWPVVTTPTGAVPRLGRLLTECLLQALGFTQHRV